MVFQSPVKMMSDSISDCQFSSSLAGSTVKSRSIFIAAAAEWLLVLGCCYLFLAAASSLLPALLLWSPAIEDCSAV